jgi:hypothetical protein
MSADDDVQVLELKTKVEVDKSMKLIDINGKKINFQSDCIVQSSSKEPFQIAIVNQEELDNGQINFEMFNKSFSRRVRYESENNEHVNHYIAFKKLKNDNDEKTIPCDIVIRLKELPMTQTRLPIPSPSQSQTYSPIPTPNPSPRHSQAYSPLPIPAHTNANMNDVNDVDDVDDMVETNKNENNDNSIYRMIAIICFIVVIGMVVFRK